MIVTHHLNKRLNNYALFCDFPGCHIIALYTLILCTINKLACLYIKSIERISLINAIKIIKVICETNEGRPEVSINKLY